MQCLYLIDVCNVSERESLHIIASADTQQEGGSKAATGETYEFAKTLLTGIVVNLPNLYETIVLINTEDKTDISSNSCDNNMSLALTHTNCQTVLNLSVGASLSMLRELFMMPLKVEL